MALTPEPARRETCLACRRPRQACLCALIAPRPTRAEVVLLQHPREAKNPVGTARLAHLAVKGSRLFVGIDFSRHPDFPALFAEREARAVVLYPSPGARDVAELGARPGALTVFVIDGTWWQAQKLWKLNPALHRLPAYRIEPREVSRYVIRSEPAPHCLSTIEAVAALLDAVDGPAGEGARLLAPLDALVAQQLGHADGGERSPRIRRARKPRPPLLPRSLRGAVDRALLFFGESSGWPARLTPPRPKELVQLLAVRPSTGERFAAFVRPPSGLAPAVLSNLRLTADYLDEALTTSELKDRWEAFVRPDDVWCGWGHLTAAMMARAGLAVPSTVDLRMWSQRMLQTRVGTIERVHEELGGGPVRPSAPGRGGRRIALLEQVFKELVGRCVEGPDRRE